MADPVTKVGPLYDAARALRRAAMKLEEYAIVDDSTTVDNRDSRMRIEAQKARIRHARTEIEAALVRMNGCEE